MESSSPSSTSSPPPASSCVPSKSSLELLNPEPWVPRNEKPPSSPDAALLEQLSVDLTNVYSAQDWTSPLLQYATSNFFAQLDTSDERLHTFAEHISLHKSLHARNPGYRFEVLDTFADVDEEKGTAKVWVLLNVIGHPREITREGVTVLWWRRTRERWKVHKQVGMRGVGWYPH